MFEILLVIDDEVICEISSKHTCTNFSCLFSVDSCVAKDSCRQFPLSFRIHSCKVRMDLSLTLHPACKVVHKRPSSYHSLHPLIPSIFYVLNLVRQKWWWAVSQASSKHRHWLLAFLPPQFLPLNFPLPPPRSSGGSSIPCHEGFSAACVRSTQR